MDKKIILSVLIVALIGIVAATYQISPGQEILNPLASVETEDAPVTEVLTAPEQSQQQAQAQAESKAKQDAKQEAQAQQAQDQAKAEAQAQQDQAQAQQAQNDANAESQAQQGVESQDTSSGSSQAGSTAKRSSVINSENPIVVTTNGNGGSSDSSGSQSASDSSGSQSTSGSSANANSGNGANANNPNGQDNAPQDAQGTTSQDAQGTTPQNDQDSTQSDGQNTAPIGDQSIIDDTVWSEIDSVIQGAKSNFAFDISADRDSCSLDDNGLYKVNIYNSKSSEFVGTLFVNIDKKSQDYGHWYLIDVEGNPQGPDAPKV